MPNRAWWSTIGWGLALALLAVMTALPARAASEEAADKPDARWEGYPQTVVIQDGGGTGGTIMFLVLLMAITGGVMFMNAKRSHLD